MLTVTFSLLASLLVLLHPERPRWTNLLVGGLIGYAVLLHYIVALCALPVAVFVALKTRSRLAVVLFLAGFLVPLSGALVYNYLCFSDPFVFGHFRSAVPEFQDFHEGMIEGFLVPRPQALWGLSFSPSKGLFFFSPALLVATFGLVRLFHCPRHRAQAIHRGWCRSLPR